MFIEIKLRSWQSSVVNNEALKCEVEENLDYKYIL